MSTYLKTSPTGIDVPIQAMQVFLYGQLKTTWGLSDADYKAYGRAYRNQSDDNGYTPEAYTGNSEYQEVLFDDTVKALSFFGAGETEKYNAGSSLAPVFMILMVNVPALKPNIVHRADEEIRQDVKRLWTMRRYGFTMTGTDTGIDNVFREYSGWRKKEGIKFRDMHPWHCFRINTSLLYENTNC